MDIILAFGPLLLTILLIRCGGISKVFFFSFGFFFWVGLFAMSHCELDHQFFIKKSETLDIPLSGSFHSQNIIEVLNLYTL